MRNFVIFRGWRVLQSPIFHYCFCMSWANIGFILTFVVDRHKVESRNFLEISALARTVNEEGWSRLKS